MMIFLPATILSNIYINTAMKIMTVENVKGNAFDNITHDKI